MARQKLATYTLAVTDSNIENVEEFLNLVLYFLISIMRSRKSSQSTNTDQIMDLPDDMNLDDMDMMCLVYPDGRTKTISTQQHSSKD